jgi:membrane-bound lytic murein transglycosylase B
MRGVLPDTTGLEAIHNQPEFSQQLWQYLNRVTSEWKIAAGREMARVYAPLFDRIEQDFGVEPSFMLGVWGIESAFGDPVVAKNHMRPVIPSLATLAWAEPRRRSYWEQEFINALTIIQNGWSTPDEMVGSWAGAMGHTQWMPEVWLHMGIDYNHDGKTSPYGPPDDALATTARYFVERGNYRRGEHWGFEVRTPPRVHGSAARTYAAWQKLGVTRADGVAFSQPNAKARLWAPVAGGPGFLIGPNFSAAKSYNPSMAYALGLVYLGDRCAGAGEPFVQKFPGSEPAPTLAEIQEIQHRLIALGFDTGLADGRIGSSTTLAVQNYQRKIGITPADGYAGVGLLARLRQGT